MNRDLGADPAQLEELGRHFDVGARTLADMGNGVSGQIGCMEWFGPDGDRVRHEWENFHRGRLYTLADALHEMAQVLLRQAEQQRRASAREGGLAPDWGHATGGDGNSLLGRGLGLLLDLGLFGLGIGDLGNDLQKLSKHMPDADFLKTLVGHIPEDLMRFAKKLPLIGDMLSIQQAWDEGDALGVALGVTGIALTGVVAGAGLIAAASGGLVTAGGIASAAVFVGGVLIAVDLVRDAIDIVGQAGELIGPAVSAMAEPIGDAVDAVVDVAAPVVEGVKDFAGDVWEEGGKLWDRLF